MEYPKYDLKELLKEVVEDDKLVTSDYKKLLSQREIQRVLAKKRKKPKRK